MDTRRCRRASRHARVVAAAETIGALVCGLFAAPARGVQIFAIDNLGATGQNPTVGDRLIRFDSANPVGTVVHLGGTGITGTNQLMSGLEFAPSGTLYATSRPTAGGGNLYTINSATGSATLIGSLGLAGGVFLEDLSYNPVTGQMLAVTSQDLDPGPNIDPVHTLRDVNLATGQALLIGNITGLQGSPGGAVAVGLATNSTGVNFLHDVITDRMYQLSGLVASPMPQLIGVDTNFSQGMTINWRGGNEWFLGKIGPVVGPFTSDVRLINNATGATQTVLGTWPTDPVSGLPEYELGDLAISGGGGGGRNLIWNGFSPMNQWNHNPANLNWLDGSFSTSFNVNDTANFTDNAVGIVNVDPGGVTPSAVNVSNTAGVYTFLGGPILGSGALTKTGNGSLVLGANNSFTGGVFINGGTVVITDNAQLGAASAALTLGGGRLLTNNIINSTRAINLSPATTSTIETGMGDATFGTATGSSASLIKMGAARLTLRRVRAAELRVLQGELEIAQSAAINDPNGISDLDSLTIAGGSQTPTARLDLSNNGLIVSSVPDVTDGDGPELSSLENTLGYVRNGYAMGAWTGNGITSGTAIDAGFPNHALGYAQASSVGIVNFGGLVVGPTDIVIKFTLHGDADLNLVVNLNDFNRLAANFGGTNKFWSDGDFNYDGNVNLNDFNLLASHFGLSAGPDGVVDPADWAALAAAVPEPGSLALVTLSMLSLARRRQRRR